MHMQLLVNYSGVASKPNRRLTGGSVRFRAVVIVNNNRRNRTEPPVNRRLGFEAVPYKCYGKFDLDKDDVLLLILKQFFGLKVASSLNHKPVYHCTVYIICP